MKDSKFAARFATILGSGLALATLGQAAVFDLGHRFTSTLNLTEVRGRLSYGTTGVFTSEADLACSSTTTSATGPSFGPTTTPPDWRTRNSPTTAR